MARNVRIATIGARPIAVDTTTPPTAITDSMVTFWNEQFAQVLPDKPDLIVVPEACDRPAGLPRETLTAYYQHRGSSVRDHFAAVALENNCNIIYSATRELPDGTWRNSSELIGRNGESIGIYNKNHLVVEETTQGGVLCGRETPVFSSDIGRVACAICFDLNFDEIRLSYAANDPDIILFSSMYHGGLMQQYWAYSCRSYFVGAIAGLPSEIRNPFGEVIASSTNYRDYAVAEVNLDFCMAHLDYNREKLVALKDTYGEGVSIHDPGFVGSVLITSNLEHISATEMAKHEEIELLDEYFPRALAHRHANLE